HGPQLHAGPGPRLDGVHETARDHVASGTDSAVRPDQQHRPRLQHPLERLAPWTRLLLPDGGDGRTGRARPGALHVPEGTELLDLTSLKNYHPHLTIDDYDGHLRRIADLTSKAIRLATTDVHDDTLVYPFMTIMMPVVMMADWIGNRDDMIHTFLEAIAPTI